MAAREASKLVEPVPIIRFSVTVFADKMGRALGCEAKVGAVGGASGEGGLKGVLLGLPPGA